MPIMPAGIANKYATEVFKSASGVQNTTRFQGDGASELTNLLGAGQILDKLMDLRLRSGRFDGSGR